MKPCMPSSARRLGCRLGVIVLFEVVSVFVLVSVLIEFDLNVIYVC
jgi:hypothetical protein